MDKSELMHGQLVWHAGAAHVVDLQSQPGRVLLIDQATRHERFEHSTPLFENDLDDLRPLNPEEVETENTKVAEYNARHDRDRTAD